MQNMRQVFPRTILLYLFIATRQSKCISSEISSYPEQTNAEVGLPHTPSLQSVMAQPQGVSVLLDAAATTLKKLYPSNWTLSAVRHVTREGEGLPHVVEWINEQLPLDMAEPRLHSKPFVVGGIIWQLYVRPLRSAGSVLLGWSFYLKAMGSPGWDTSDYVNVTLDMAMPYAGRGFRKQEGVGVRFEIDGKLWSPRRLAFLPSVDRPYSVDPNDSGNFLFDEDFVREASEQAPAFRSHILRLTFTKVLPSWAVKDIWQRHVEASYYRAANRYRDVVRRAGLYGVRQRFDAAVRRSVQRQGPIVYNVYYCKDKVYEETAQVQLVTSFVVDNLLCHMGKVKEVDAAKLAAVVAMLVARAGDEGDEMRHLVRVIKDPSVRGGLRYVDPSDGEDLTRYGTECTEKPRTARHSTGSAAGGAVDEVRRLEYEVFYDGLSNPKANDEVQNAERAEAVVGLLKLVVREDLQREGDWGEDWYKLRDSHYSRKALLRPEDSAGHGWTSCVVRLPSEGPFQAVEWTVFSFTHPTELSEDRQSVPFAAGGLVWVATLRSTHDGICMTLQPYGDLVQEVKAVHGTAWYEVLSGHLNGTGLPAATVGDGAFVIDAKSSSVTLWSLSSSGGGAGLGAELSSDAPANIVVHLYLNASAEWRETRNGRGRAAYEAAFQQLQSLRVADYLNVGRRFRKTVRMATVAMAADAGVLTTVWLKRNDRAYTPRTAHELLDELVQENLMCLTGSKEIATAKRSAVYDMNLLRSLRNDSRLWEQRAVHAPKVVVLHPDPHAADSRSKDGHQATSVRYFDEYGYDITPYYAECTTDLVDLEYDMAFGEDLEEDDSNARKCWWLGVTVACCHDVLVVLDHGLVFVIVICGLYSVIRSVCYALGLKSARRWPLLLERRLAKWFAGLSRGSNSKDLEAKSFSKVTAAADSAVFGLAEGKHGTKSPDGQPNGRTKNGQPSRKGGSAPGCTGRGPGGGNAKGARANPAGTTNRTNSGSSSGGSPPSPASSVHGTEVQEPAAAKASTAAPVDPAPSSWAATGHAPGRLLWRLLAPYLGVFAAPVTAPGATPAPASPSHSATPSRTPSNGQLAQQERASSPRRDGGQLQQEQQQQQQQQRLGDGLRLRQRRGSTSTSGTSGGTASDPSPAHAATPPPLPPPPPPLVPAATQQQFGARGPSTAALQDASRPARGKQAAVEEPGNRASAATGVGDTAARPEGPVTRGGGLGAAVGGIPVAAVRGPQPQAGSQVAAEDEDEAVCLVCHDGPRQWGFLHGGSVHVGVCGGCRELVRARAGAGGAVSCPVCREAVDGIIKLIQA